VSLPTADDLFRPTDASEAPTEVEEPRPGRRVRVEPRPGRRVRAVPATGEGVDEPRMRRPSGRVRHDEKMTVYVTSDELLDLDSARLALRREHGLAVDRGRIVREAIALVLADLEEHGYDSLIVQRLVEE
jgi:hypothetical protein